MFIKVAQQLKKKILLQEPAKSAVNDNPMYTGYPGDYLVTTERGNQAIIPKAVLEELLFSAGIYEPADPNSVLAIEGIALS